MHSIFFSAEKWIVLQQSQWNRLKRGSSFKLFFCSEIPHDRIKIANKWAKFSLKPVAFVKLSTRRKGWYEILKIRPFQPNVTLIRLTVDKGPYIWAKVIFVQPMEWHWNRWLSSASEKSDESELGCICKVIHTLKRLVWNPKNTTLSAECDPYTTDCGQRAIYMSQSHICTTHGMALE